MLTAVRAMARRVAHDLAHMDRQRLGPGVDADRAGRAACAGAGERARGRQGGRGARARAARRAPRGRRGRRRRLRPDRDRGRLPRGAARRAPRPSSSTSFAPGARCTAPSTSPRASATAPTSRSPGSGLDAGSFAARLEAHRATPCWWSATTARCACTSTPTTPSGPWPCSTARARSRASTWPTCTSRWRSAPRGCRRRRPGRPTPPARSSRWRAARACGASTRSSACWWSTAARR